MGILEFSLPKLQIFMLLFFRVTTVLMVLPVFDNTLVLPRYKILLSYVIALALLPLVNVPGGASILPVTVGGLVWTILREIFVGFVIGFTAKLIFAGVEMAAQFGSVQMGFGAANVLDPVENQQITVITQFQLMLAIVIFLTLDGHYMFFTAMVDSLKHIPLGTGGLTPQLAKTLVDLSKEVFIIGIKLSAPLTAVMILTNIALGIMARFIPQINILMVSFPITIGIGLIVLGASVPFFVYAIKIMFKTLASDLALVVSLM